MFRIDEVDGAVTVSQGDTGSFELEAQRLDGQPWTAEDRATLVVYDGEEILIERIYRLDNPEEDPTLENGVIRIEFTNADTKDLPTGSHKWEMRFAIGAYGEEVVSGDNVDTPGMDGEGNPMNFTVKPVKRRI